MTVTVLKDQKVVVTDIYGGYPTKRQSLIRQSVDCFLVAHS